MIRLPVVAAYARSRRDGDVAAQPHASCELCGSQLEVEHRHVIEVGARGVRCACRACGLLFARTDALTPYRTVPDRVLADPSFTMSADAWAQLGVPVGLAFFVRSADGVAVHYPGPAGVTDAELADHAWDALACATPLAAQLALDVEALLVHRERGATTVACYLVPITSAYELAGTLRQTWRGFAGGDDAQHALAGFFAGLESAAAGGAR